MQPNKHFLYVKIDYEYLVLYVNIYRHMRNRLLLHWLRDNKVKATQKRLFLSTPTKQCNMAVRPLDESSVEKKLRSLTNTQDSIQGLSLWIIHHKAHHEKIVELWFKAMKKGLFRHCCNWRAMAKPALPWTWWPRSRCSHQWQCFVWSMITDFYKILLSRYHRSCVIVNIRKWQHWHYKTTLPGNRMILINDAASAVCDYHIHDYFPVK